MPAIATISLFTMVGQWNSWFDGLIYMNDASKYPLATLMQTIIVQQDFSNMNVDATQAPEHVSTYGERGSDLYWGSADSARISVLAAFLRKGDCARGGKRVRQTHGIPSWNSLFRKIMISVDSRSFSRELHCYIH